MKLAISQPTFLPWSGYFSLISNVDEFIFLDNVQFNKRSWQQRNYIISQKKFELISIPVKSKGLFNQNLRDVEIDYENFNLEKILKKLHFSYKKDKYFEKIFYDLKNIFELKHKYLAELNIDIIQYICEFLNIKTNFLKSSSIKTDKKLKKIELLGHIAKNRNAKEYISTEGSRKYFETLKKFPNTSISIKYFKYGYKNIDINSIDKFPCILDLLFKEGINTRRILMDNFILVDQ
tara:strand:- start:1281 stop:1985 length:705 start_codon:yes stop_codon:yes gene_type:complete